MISVSDAYVLLQARAGQAEQIELSLAQAYGHVLAQTVCADRDFPPFDRAMMDGYAVRAEDTLNAPAVLKVVDYLPAGTQAAHRLQPGEAMRIFTGAPCPPGADAVAMQERTVQLDKRNIRIEQPVKPGQHISQQASDTPAGAVVIPSGTLLGPAEIGVLASVGCALVPVYRKPRLAILGTGDELVEPGAIPEGAQIRNSNSYQLLAQAASHGLEAEYLGIAPDERLRTRRLVERGLDADVFISTGGASVGEKDHIGPVFRELEVEICFNKLAMKPGKPTTFGVRGRTLVFGLPGNPVAALVCFHLFVMTAIRKRMGYRQPLPHCYELPLHCGVAPAGDRPTFRPAKLVQAAHGLEVSPVEWHGSAHLTACAGIDGFVLQAADVPLIQGQLASFLPLNR